jgi:hypothetical protein
LTRHGAAALGARVAHVLPLRGGADLVRVRVRVRLRVRLRLRLRVRLRARVRARARASAAVPTDSFSQVRCTQLPHSHLVAVRVGRVGFHLGLGRLGLG